MSTIEGKWKLVSETNMEAFYNAIGTAQEFIEKLKAIEELSKTDPAAHVEELVIDLKDQVVDRKIFIKGEMKWQIVHHIGVDEDVKGPDDRVGKGRCDLAGDNKITFHNKGDDFEMSGSLEAEGNELNLTVVSGGVTATQTFSRL